MAKILASIVGKLFTLLAWDGTDFRNLKVNEEGRLEVAIQEIIDPTGNPTPNIIMAFDDVMYTYKTLTAAAGTNDYTTPLVPAGEMWLLQAIGIFNIDHNPGMVKVTVINGIGGVDVLSAVAPGTNTPVCWSGNIWMKEGGYLWCRQTGCTAGDTLWTRGVGYKIKV